MTFVLDTSVIVDGRVLKLLNKGVIKDSDVVVVPNAVLAELEHQANKGLVIGMSGLDVLHALKQAVRVEFLGPVPSPVDIAHAKDTGAIDRMIRELAKQLNAVLVTGDRVQARVAEIEGVETLFLEQEHGEHTIPRLLSLFDDDVMSVHVKGGVKVKMKKGDPAHVQLVETDVIFDEEALKNAVEELVEYAKRNNGMFELSFPGVDVIQLNEHRVIITKPPVSDGWEVTITKPLVHLSLRDYHLHKKLMHRMEHSAEGIVICGRPGSGKSTFAAALANFYAQRNKVVKTIENPRDLAVREDVTQYLVKDEGSKERLKDVLLLVRPDYTVYDEVRTSTDFKLFADLRIAGIGMVGVIHSTSAIDAIHRFLNHVDHGTLPHVVDTVMFIDKGEVAKIYELSLTIKVPHGMREKDLARPVVEVIDFLTGLKEYEIYKFGEETVIAPLSPVLEEKSVVEDKLRKLLRSFSLRVVGGQLVLVVKSKELKRLKAKQLKRLSNVLKRYNVKVEEVE